MLSSEEYIKKAKDHSIDPEALVEEAFDGINSYQDAMSLANEFSLSAYGKKSYEYIIHEDKKILFVDGSNSITSREVTLGAYTTAKMFSLIDSEKDFSLNEKKLMLMNFVKMHFSPEYRKAAIKLKESSPDMQNSKTAIYGLSSMQLIIVKAAIRKGVNVSFFKTREEALNWLVTD